MINEEEKAKDKARLEEKISRIAEEVLLLNEKLNPKKVEAWVTEQKKTDSGFREWNAEYLMPEALGGHSTEWQSLCREGAALICRYEVLIFGIKVVEKHSITLMKLIPCCFKKYDSNQGPFIHYLQKTVANEFERAENKSNKDMDGGGINVPEKKKQRVNEFITWAENLGKNPDNLKVQEYYCKWRGIQLKKLQKAMEVVYHTGIGDEDVSGVGHSDTPEEELLKKDENNKLIKKLQEFEECFSKLEKIYKRKTSRKNGKPLYYKVLITHWILEEIEKCSNVDLFLQKLEQRNFADEVLISKFKKDGSAGTRKDAVNDEGRNLKTDEGQAKRNLDEILDELKGVEEQ